MLKSLKSKHLPRAFTLVELLVALAIIGILVSLLMVAINQTRARARRIGCISNLRQQALAVLQHEASSSHLPTGGWGRQWVAVKGRGFGTEQPGGWIYNILPFIEANDIYGMAPQPSKSMTTEVFQTFVGSTIPVLVCPERGNYSLPVSEQFQPKIGSWVASCAKTDYAINGGNDSYDTIDGPESISGEDSFSWPNFDWVGGVSFVRSKVRIRDVRDGAGSVFLCGEKHAYLTGGSDAGNNQPIVSGDCSDIRRFVGFGLIEFGVPGRHTEFGSWHNDGVGFAFCDGSARTFAFETDRRVLQSLADRNDG
jgi:prepilin-type N-terminal cleavage/methylation domain-containing protein/prepilin-type processing-associated H-X9-DG protein